MVYFSRSRSRNLTGQSPKYKTKPSRTFERQVESRSLSSTAGRQSKLFKKLDDYQQKAVIFSAGLAGSALFFEQRTGKTWIAASLLEYVDAEAALFVVPLNNLETTWVKIFTEQLPQWKIFRTWEEFKVAKGKRILLINYEALAPRRFNKRRTKMLRQLVSFPWNLVVFDESQRLKSRSASNSRLARRLRKADRRVLLSGTPMDKSPIEIWGQMRFAEPTALGETFAKFTDRFCTRGGFKNKVWSFNDEKMEEYLEALKPYTMRIEKVDIGMKPPIVTVDHVMMLGRQARIYQKMMDTSVVKIGKNRIKADRVITQRIKLQQITSGFIIDDNDNILHVGNAKARKLKWRIQQVKLPVVIFCKYIEDIDIIYETIKPYVKRIGIVYGKVKDTKKEKTRSNLQVKFQSGELDALICQQRTGGVGSDYFKADTAIFYSMTHSWIDYDQARSRIEHRDKRHATELFLISAYQSIDDDIIEAVRSKRSLTQVVLERLKHQGE
jgi:SNF2 family DNA or RNA helicase